MLDKALKKHEAVGEQPTYLNCKSPTGEIIGNSGGLNQKYLKFALKPVLKIE